MAQVDAETALLDARLAFAEEEARLARLYPADDYLPHHQTTRGPRAGLPSGQRQFHESSHKIRVAAPGNGWGGTTAMLAEVDAWMRHVNRWQQTPSGRVLAVWFCPEFRQFEIIRQSQHDALFGPSVTFTASGFGGPRYIWPDGGTLYVASYDRDWTHVQGIEVDLVAFDEQPPITLWLEMQQRRRGKRKTRYICKATQTQGWSWMADDIYLPWLKFHEALGMDEETAMAEQRHPDIWCWPKGGLHDNPAADEEDIQHYLSQPWPSEMEKQVRVFGGFRSWSGHCVFDVAGLQRLAARATVLEGEHGPGRRGTLLHLGKAQDYEAA